MKMKKQYENPNFVEQRISIEDIILVSTSENRDIFDFDEEL